MKKKLIIFILCFQAYSLFALPTSEGIPYHILYGPHLIYDLNQEPILAALKQDLANSDLLGNLPSFDLFKQSTERLKYPNGNILVSFEITPDGQSGTQYIYYENGNIMARIPYVNQQKSGITKIYYSNGILYAAIPYTADVLNGDLITYFQTGIMKMKQSFSNGIPVNTGRMFHMTNRVQLEQTYDSEGYANGIQTQYYEDGETIQSVIPYQNGYIEGTVRLYYPDSTQLAEVTFKNKEIVSNKCFTMVGQISRLDAIGLYQLENGIRPIQCPYQNVSLPLAD